MLKLGLVIALLPLTAFAQHFRQPFGGRAHIGVLVGTSLTSNVSPQNLDASIFGPGWTVKVTDGPQKIIVGPTFEFDLGRQFAIEADALYRPIEAEIKLNNSSNPNVSVLQTNVHSNTWEFPVLGKKYFQVKSWRPFVGAGPSFRHRGNFDDVWQFGVTAAAGAEFSWHKLRIVPSIRYSHWGKGEDEIELARNEAAIFLGISF